MAKSENKFSFNNFLNFLNEHFSLIVIILIVLVLGFLGGSLWTENQLLKSDKTIEQADNPSDSDEGVEALALENIPEFNDKDHFQGVKDADVVMISYSDFQCFYCQRWHPTLNALVEKYADQITFVYRHFSLGSIYSDKLIQASECVAKDAGEDAFWKFTDVLYDKLTDKSIYILENGDSIISDSSILSIATSSGASADQVQACLEKQETASIVSEMMAGAQSAGIGGTPATVIISKKAGREFIQGALPIEEVEATLAKHL
ncbi:MAG: thioredoxin domain-containing protein [Candidatus Pacebacteria bacterium]|nr:thioredoxin domain-containing protein [Candidatus Paceibacterota bacterium]